VAPFADLAEMTRMWATDKYIGQWDGYAGTEDEWLPNNYYLYSDPGGRFQMMPWGNDESWQTAYRLPFAGSAGLLFDSCLAGATCAALYREAVAAVRGTIAGVNLDGLAPRCLPPGSSENRPRAIARSTTSVKSPTKWPTPGRSSRPGRVTPPSG
jgi:hypothetical protein